MGQQDTGAFGTPQAASTPDWNSPDCCDVFDVEAEDNRVVYTVCCFFGGRATRMFLDDDSMDGGSEIPNYPGGNLFAFQDLDTLTNYAATSYAVVTSTGVFFSTNIGAGTITWQQLGTGAPANPCGICASRTSGGTPVFFLSAGFGACGLGSIGTLWWHDGATATGAWEQVKRNGVSQFGAFGIDPADPNHIVANDLSSGDPQMVHTTDSGTTWTALPQLDQLCRCSRAQRATATRRPRSWRPTRATET